MRTKNAVKTAKWIRFGKNQCGKPKTYIPTRRTIIAWRGGKWDWLKREKMPLKKTKNPFTMTRLKEYYFNLGFLFFSRQSLCWYVYFHSVRRAHQNTEIFDDFLSPSAEASTFVFVGARAYRTNPRKINVKHRWYISFEVGFFHCETLKKFHFIQILLLSSFFFPLFSHFLSILEC